MSRFVISPHFRLQEWVAEEKGYFAGEDLDYEFHEAIGTKDSKEQNHPDGVRKYFRALRRAQRDIDLRPELSFGADHALAYQHRHRPVRLEGEHRRRAHRLGDGLGRLGPVHAHADGGQARLGRAAHRQLPGIELSPLSAHRHRRPRSHAVGTRAGQVWYDHQRDTASSQAVPEGVRPALLGAGG